MKIYVSHSSNFDYWTELYEPLVKAFAVEHELYLPHDNKNKGQESKQFVIESDVVLAEVSHASTGQGIELGWANAVGVPIVCFYKVDCEPSGTLQYIAKAIFPYDNIDGMVRELRRHLN